VVFCSAIAKFVFISVHSWLKKFSLFSELPSAIPVERGERNLESTRTDTNVGKAENHGWRGITRIKGNVGSARDSRELMPMIFLL
jgi:hypothetical protein